MNTLRLRRAGLPPSDGNSAPGYEPTYLIQDNVKQDYNGGAPPLDWYYQPTEPVRIGWNDTNAVVVSTIRIAWA